MTKVSLVKCGSYQPHEVRIAVRRSLDLLGGISAFVKPGQKVLLKPNLLSYHHPDKAVTTHPVFLEAALELVKSAGGVPVVGDSPIGSARHIEEYWEVTGFQEVCRRQGAELVAFEKSGVYKKDLNGRNYHIARPVLDAEVIINLPKLKSHSLTLLTCAVKNMYGAVPGLKKSMYHREAPLPMEFSKLLLDIYALARPQLNLVDAVIGMDGNGPSAGDPKPIGMIMAGADGVAIDCLAAHLMGMDPLKVPTNRLARKISLGETQLKNIERLGDAIEVRNDFRWPSTWAYSLIPSFLARHMAKLFWIRPAIDPVKCVNCGACVESCPTSAISSGEPTPVFNYRLCINCLCCQEICPQQAVHPRRSLIAKMVR
ncbi:MAG: DUF362 domain-containing protein [Candidatus Edwardsbacteria bacterium]|nr:DUF362 domain-containing protein [Candidatus Edwardsbacteria bacterium]